MKFNSASNPTTDSAGTPKPTRTYTTFRRRRLYSTLSITTTASPSFPRLRTALGLRLHTIWLLSSSSCTKLSARAFSLFRFCWRISKSKQLLFRGYFESYFSIFEACPPRMRLSITFINHIQSDTLNFSGSSTLLMSASARPPFTS